MPTFLNTFLQFFRVLDENSQLSLTNLSVIGMLIKTLLNYTGGGSSSNADLIALGLVLTNYAAKRLIRLFEDKNKKPESSLVSLTETVTKLKEEQDILRNKISSLALVAGMKPQPPRLGL